MRTRAGWVIYGALIIIALSACAAGENPAVDVPDSEGDLAGFWTGLWQGFIVPVTFIISLFTESVSIYEVHNTGSWYDFGFLIGTSSVLGGGGAGARVASK
jgi:hypothetical protein